MFSDNEVMDEFQAADQIINFTKKSQVQSKSALQRPYQTEIRQIADMFRNIQCNRHPSHKNVYYVSITKKVTFQDDVIVHRLVRPDIVYFCQKPIVVQLDLEQHKPNRKLLGPPMRFCICNLCRLQKSERERMACNRCFAGGKISDTEVLN